LLSDPGKRGNFPRSISKGTGNPRHFYSTTPGVSGYFHGFPAVFHGSSQGFERPSMHFAENYRGFPGIYLSLHGFLRGFTEVS